MKLGLASPLAGPCQGLCLVTSCGLSKTLGSLPADGWTGFSHPIAVWPEVFQHRFGRAVGWGQVLVRKWWPPESSCQQAPSRTIATSVFVPAESSSHLLLVL